MSGGLQGGTYSGPEVMEVTRSRLRLDPGVDGVFVSIRLSKDEPLPGGLHDLAHENDVFPTRDLEILAFKQPRSNRAARVVVYPRTVHADAVFDGELDLLIEAGAGCAAPRSGDIFCGCCRRRARWSDQEHQNEYADHGGTSAS